MFGLFPKYPFVIELLEYLLFDAIAIYFLDFFGPKCFLRLFPRDSTHMSCAALLIFNYVSCTKCLHWIRFYIKDGY